MARRTAGQERQQEKADNSTKQQTRLVGRSKSSKGPTSSKQQARKKQQQRCSTEDPTVVKALRAADSRPGRAAASCTRTAAGSQAAECRGAGEASNSHRSKSQKQQGSKLLSRSAGRQEDASRRYTRRHKVTESLVALWRWTQHDGGTSHRHTSHFECTGSKHRCTPICCSVEGVLNKHLSLALVY